MDENTKPAPVVGLVFCGYRDGRDAPRYAAPIIVSGAPSGECTVKIEPNGIGMMGVVSTPWPASAACSVANSGVLK